jgi:8-oxo-dGTP diphosphatase
MTSSSGTPKAPGVGVALIVWENSERERLLVGLGHSAENRDSLYAVPGGHWESGETLSEAAARETAEEAGISVRDMRLVSVYEFFNPEKLKSYVTIGFECYLAGGAPTVMEPENKAGWDWLSPTDALSLPLFAPDRVLIERAVSGVMHETLAAK